VTPFRLFGGWVALLLLTPVGADEPKKADPIRALIDQLADLDQQDTGYSGGDSGTAFLPLNRTEGGPVLLSPRQGKSGPSDAMRSLVKLGMKAVPALLDHLSDDRKTKIDLFHAGGFGGMFITQDKGEMAEEEIKGEVWTGKKYTVRVGDLCYVALGQIVNRDYTAVSYAPTAIIYATCVPKSKDLREGLKKEWGGLTADKHRDSLAKDLDSDGSSIREGASVRLAYYYPDALETLALAQLKRPAYVPCMAETLIREKLYPAETAKERKAIVDEYVKKHGQVARAGIRMELFKELDTQEAVEEGRTTQKPDPPVRARECLIEVFGLPKTVKSSDLPEPMPLSTYDQARFIESLLYDRSEKLDRAIRDILAKTDDHYIGRGCLNRLVGRGYDTDIEAYLKRRAPEYQKDSEFVEAFQSMLGWTYLHRAVDLDVPDLIETALKDKPGVNAQAKNGRTALHLAAAEGKAGAVEQLAAAKADPNMKDAAGKLPVQLAAHADHAEIVRRLVAAKSAIPDALTAAVVGDADRLTELLRADPAGVKVRTEDGFTPLHLAAREGHEKAAGVLLAAGADVKAVDVPARWGQESWRALTPLHVAATAGKAGVVKLLLDKGAEVNAPEKYGPWTALHYAAGLGHADVVKVLLAAKADREAKDEKGRTPLTLANEGKHTAVVKLLEAK
jgi:ankyrin repeat protein